MRIAFVQTDDEWKDLAELIGQVFGPDDRRLWESFHGREPFCRRDCCLIARENGKIASHICWVPRSIRVGSVIIRAGAIGYTVTDPAYRGRGLAAGLMNFWKDHLAERGEHLSFIVGIPYFYERFGYEFAFPLDMRDAPVVIDTNHSSHPAGTGKASQYQPGDLPDLMELYDRENKARTGSQVRTREYWHWLLEGLQASGRLKREDIWLVRDFVGKSSGYAFLRPGFQDALEIWEASAADEDTARAIINLAVELARREHRQHIDIKLPLDHVITRYALCGGARLRGYSSGIFARILNLQCLFTALVPELERRLRNSPFSNWEGTLLLETDIGELSLAIQKGAIRLGETAGQVLSLRIPQSLLARLVTGYASPHWIAGALNMLHKTSRSSTPIPVEALPILEALFPKGCPYMWNADIGY